MRSGTARDSGRGILQICIQQQLTNEINQRAMVRAGYFVVTKLATKLLSNYLRSGLCSELHRITGT
jgi:hypothetical protein